MKTLNKEAIIDKNITKPYINEYITFKNVIWQNSSKQYRD